MTNQSTEMAGRTGPAAGSGISQDQRLRAFVVTSLGIGLTIASSLLSGFAQNLGRLHVAPDGSSFRITVTNANVPNVNLRGSFNLKDWFILGYSEPVAGVATFNLTNREPVGAWFFRAVAEPAPRRINVGPQVDTNISVGTVIFPDTGGRLDIVDANGVQYSLIVGSNLVSQPSAIRMTVVTNFVSMPYSNSFRAAVVFEPDGFEFEGEAELRIRFPERIPSYEMIGYGFDGAGGDLHLRPWEATTNEVTLAISHFSGAGVAAVPFPLTGNHLQRHDQAYEFTRDVVRIADDWAGERFREKYQQLKNGQITDEQARESFEAIRGLRDELIYVNALKPLFAAIESDCALGEVILRRLKHFRSTSVLFTTSFYMREIRDVALRIRCTCSRFFLDLCEKNASTSGINATDGLSTVLDRVAQLVGPATGDMGCSLGTDEEIRQRLARAQCHKPWEGSLRYRRLYISGVTNELSSEMINLQREEMTVSYEGWIRTLVEQDGDGGKWQSWIFKLRGKLNAAEMQSDTTTYTTKDYVMTDLDKTTGLDQRAAEGEMMIRFDNNQFSWASGSAGLGGERYKMPLVLTTERKVRCLRPGACPQPIAAKSAPAGTRDLSFADMVSHNDPEVKYTWDPTRGVLKISAIRRTQELYDPPIVGRWDVVETMEIDLLRAQ